MGLFKLGISIKNRATIVLILLSTLASNAQLKPEDKLGTWFSVGGKHHLSNKLSLNVSTEFWFYEVASNFNFVLVYTGANYKISPKATFTLNYGHLSADTSIKNTTDIDYLENRFLEQFSYKHKFFNLPVTHRFRAEQRFYNYEDEQSLEHRFRYRIGSKLKITKGIHYVFNNEILGTLDESIVSDNRFYSALNFKLSKTNSLELGYMNLNDSETNLHRLQVGIYFSTM